jgi:hypothetical protein
LWGCSGSDMTRSRQQSVWICSSSWCAVGR